jgi:hypothetical protein
MRKLGEPLVVPVAQLAAGLIQCPFANVDDAAVGFRQRDKQVWRNHPVLGVLPAQQGLDADHAMIAVANLRLVDQVQLVAQQGFAQVFFQFAAAAHLAVDAGDIKLIAVARAAFGQGHGLLGLLQQLLGGVAIFREQGDADGGAQADILLIDAERRLQVIENALRQLGGLVRLLDVRLNQGKLVAAQTRQCTEATAVRPQAVGQGLQQLVAGLITKLFVDALEVIQPHAQHGDPALRAA